MEKNQEAQKEKIEIGKNYLKLMRESLNKKDWRMFKSFRNIAKKYFQKVWKEEKINIFDEVI